MTTATRGNEKEITSLELEENRLVAEIKRTAKTGKEASIPSFPPLPSHPTPLPQPPCTDPSPSVDATPSEPLISSVATPSSAGIIPA
ncbi:hypothetical protein IFM89_029177 [Coptis chinensis]|uniref:Uncharacterized protein n=1 Tax=Coptis chinensis TaxID=261450 RepID=A0A835ISN6_9MAGN|nr:hypothetical protein IFM89_029177 [Coptis chinensis]